MTRDSAAIWTPSPNCWPGRMGRKPKWIILHGTAGGGAVSWLTNPASQVSAHYVISQSGEIYQLVDEGASAWANGELSAGHDSWWSSDVNPNLETISIEHEKPDDQNATAITPAQALASFQLISRICQRWNIPARPADQNGGITGHYSIDPAYRSHCPGLYPWSDLYNFLTQTNGGDLAMLALSDPIGRFFTQVNAQHWFCKQTNCSVAYAILDFYRKYEGVFGLPITNEIYLQSLQPNTAIQVFERAVLIYDPGYKNEIKNASTAPGPVYMMRLDQGIGQQLIAKPIIAELQAQVSQLQAQLSAANASAISSAELEATKSALASAQSALHAIYSASAQFVESKVS